MGTLKAVAIIAGDNSVTGSLHFLQDLDGVAEVSIKDMKIPLSGQHSILGRAVVVHADPDDLGRDQYANYHLQPI
ncbi:hypothetical protein RJ640_029311 [Escallonia rubra]|uniref:Superoxide dismutase copper/zinc binding domain-containing protein n=1 Tax=Escallonia rubra TaxID=112253 RepID=A0AA88UDU9_9ASTE|nr:hypothetical protein RJ640_029311 [Escallonia rubra]